MRSILRRRRLLSIGVFIVVSLFVSVGVLWWTGDGTRSVLIGVICGRVAVLAVAHAVGCRPDNRGNALDTNTSDLGMDMIAE